MLQSSILPQEISYVKTDVKTLKMGFLANMNLRVKPGGVIALVVGLAIVWIYFFGIPFLGHRGEPDIQYISMKQLLCASIDVTKRGGDIVRDLREKATASDLNIKSKGLTAEGAKQLYTTGDMESHKVMTYGIRKAFPHLTVISEEKSKTPILMETVVQARIDDPTVQALIQADESIPVSDLAVWVDPLDATQEYTENLVQYVTTMVCVAIKGVPVIGVIHRPFKQETVWAWVGHGHSSNIKPLPPVTGPTKATRIIVSRSHAGNVSKIATVALGDKTTVKAAGGAGYKSLALVQGEADIYIHTTVIKKWDICAGDAILRELNGHMTDLDGKLIDYSVSGNPKNDHGLLAAITNHSTYLTKLKLHKIH